jgi:hypothetical protein
MHANSREIKLYGAGVARKMLIPSLFVFAASIFAADAPNIAGQWAVHTTVEGNESDQDCTFTHEENIIGGTCKYEQQTMKVTGSVEGKKAVWRYNAEYNGSTLTVTYTATLDNPDKISGSVDVEPMAVSGDFTAKRTK